MSALRKLLGAAGLFVVAGLFTAVAVVLDATTNPPEQPELDLDPDDGLTWTDEDEQQLRRYLAAFPPSESGE